MIGNYTKLNIENGKLVRIVQKKSGFPFALTIAILVLLVVQAGIIYLYTSDSLNIPAIQQSPSPEVEETPTVEQPVVSPTALPNVFEEATPSSETEETVPGVDEAVVTL